MQTFLPHPNFRKSLECLDRGRLGKQRVEAFQLLVANGDSWALEVRAKRTGNDTPTKGWKNHPAAIMWKEYPDALRLYYNTAIKTWVSQDRNNTMEEAPVGDFIEYPHWLGDNRVHSSHRSRLLFKGKTDLLAERIKRFTGERGTKKWLKTQGFKEINTFREAEYQAVMALLDTLGAEPIVGSNHYRQFDWTEPDSLEYIWPDALPLDLHF